METKYSIKPMISAGRFLEARGEEAVSIFSLCVMCTCVFLQVVFRYVFSKSLPWAEEVAVYGMVWAVYMGAAAAVRDRAHLRILDGVLKLPRAIGAGIIVVADLLWLAFNILMVLLGIQYLQLLWQRTFVSPALGIDQKWPQMCVALGFLLMIIRLFQIYYGWCRRGFKGYPL